MLFRELLIRELLIFIFALGAETTNHAVDALIHISFRQTDIGHLHPFNTLCDATASAVKMRMKVSFMAMFVAVVTTDSTHFVAH